MKKKYCWVNYYVIIENQSFWNIQSELDFSNYAIKKELEKASGIDTSDLAATKDFNALIVKVDKQDINKLVNVASGITK